MRLTLKQCRCHWNNADNYLHLGYVIIRIRLLFVFIIRKGQFIVIDGPIASSIFPPLLCTHRRLTQPPIAVVNFASTKPLLWFGDLTWYSSGVLFWHLAENAVGVLCACMPSFAPLLKGRITGTTKSKSGRGGDTTGSSHHKATPLSPFYERIEDETPLHRPGAGSINSNPGFEEHALHAVGHGRKRTSSEPRDDASYEVHAM